MKPPGRPLLSSGPARPPARPWWPWLKRLATLVFFAWIAWMLVAQARGIDWDAVLDALRRLSLPVLLAAAGLAAASFALYSTYDLLGRHLTGHRLGTGTVMGVAFISYAFNLNLGALLGGVALRYRLYSRLGLGGETITRVLGVSLLTNWLGYLAVAGAAFCFGPLALPADWRIGRGGLRLLGAVLLALALAYLVLCATARQTTWQVRGHTLQVPPLRLALLQLAVASLDWSLIGGMVWLLLLRQIPYAEVLAVLLIGAVAGVLTHVPAGLGVLEAVFLALLAHRLPQGQILAALIGYRALYYLLPLAFASLGYLGLEWRARHGPAAPSGKTDPNGPHAGAKPPGAQAGLLHCSMNKRSAL